MDFYKELAEIFDEEINENTNLYQLESYDSFSILSIISLAEEKYSIDINGSDVRKYETAGKLKEFFEQLIK